MYFLECRFREDFVCIYSVYEVHYSEILLRREAVVQARNMIKTAISPESDEHEFEKVLASEL